MAKRRVMKKGKFMAEPIKLSGALRSCARSLRCSFLGLQYAVPFSWVHEYSPLCYFFMMYRRNVAG